MEKDSILYTQNLSIGYQQKNGNIVVASEINIALKAGMLMTIAGANGIGKSTLLRTLTGIQHPLSGKVILDGAPLDDCTPLALAQKISVVLTEKLPPGNLTVYEIIALGRQPYTNWLGSLSAEDKTKINHAIGLAGISDLLHKKHYEISDGQLQRVMIARALAQDTPIIILDEPTTHLDLPHKIRLFALLKKLATETGKCILFSTHDIDLAIEISDEMIVMTPGHFIQDVPKKLIEKQVFNALFEKDNIRFDAEKGRFVMD
ncbi:ABC transporter ATP-binding protein [Flavobacterium pallidum]|uniref:ABC transporter ATP-binding protein n=1 Tax=Flavobacterium pallidum TaxID=2172098 RepID=A0A2S1SHI6_9FLAO|nr:ABC transporter ATP-binding protein [Flavobacterium pallidum]AWI25829.1 ABC transporter ATP-binding protein [Flavobacterium pallidum]